MFSFHEHPQSYDTSHEFKENTSESSAKYQKSITDPDQYQISDTIFNLRSEKTK